ncbi:PEP-CTERM sorting domain-containing protein [Lacipirellula parvula]|uniref:Ice-binding protein C-terminal domain-containing protein n=1 Tax=Lacipirellula parvula TaxID=2650471 RepID=A0A5K7X8H5_9BACT|nr:PEP-CTERM sorting domain-containing protein [Lacipirellula parvula]BBO30733.1 hypothetical protein PLANPX_0345 [Lacipirellula parvula]
MKIATWFLAAAATTFLGMPAWGAPTAVTTHGPANTSLAALISTNDLIAGQIGVELAGDMGWHPANPAAPNSLLPEGLPTFTDGVNNTGLYGLLNDLPAAGTPVKRVQYTLGGAKTINEIQILTGNNGKDGRVFSTTVISTSTNGGGSFSTLGYFQSDLSGTINTGQWGSTLVEITNGGGGPLASGVTNVIFDFYAVDNTQGELRDPFVGVNPFTGIDDGFNAPIASPLVWEIDVIGVPEPATGLLAATALIGLIAQRHRRRR